MPNFQKQINKFSKKYKNKRILAYGAGQFAEDIFKNYNLSSLNIVAIADKKFEKEKTMFYNIRTVAPNELKTIDYDLILIMNKDFEYFKNILKTLLVNSKNANQKIISIQPKTFSFNITQIFSKYLKKIESLKRKSHLEKIKKNVIKTAKFCGEGLWIGGETKVTSNTILSDHVSFNGMTIIGRGKVSIGRYFHSGVECLIITQNHNYDNGDAIPYDSTYIYKDVEIGDFVWLGSRVMILPGTKIGEGAIIQGGAVVHGEIPPYAIAGGNPAKVFKYRNIEHFKKLKAEKKFH